MKEQHPLVSVVVTTRNEERNIVNCLKSIAIQTWPNVETIVVDNQSTDKTKDLALAFTEKVYDKGPERAAQRNYGIIEVAKGQFAMFIDADMILTPTLIERCVLAMKDATISALHIEEIVLGRGLLAKIRRFERGFYSGTVVDGVRFFRRDDFIRVGGFDHSLPPGPEDWDLDKKFRSEGELKLLPSVGVASDSNWREFLQDRGLSPDPLFVGIYHNEDEQNLKRYLQKKIYYSGSMEIYVAKWGRSDHDVKKQLGFVYRYLLVFIEGSKWRRLLRHPLLAFAMIQLRVLVGMAYLISKDRAAVTKQ